MDKDLAVFLDSFEILSADDKQVIGEHLLIREYEKGKVLLSEGEISARCFFSLKGCVRQYYLMDGEEKTTAFFTERQPVTSYMSYIDQTPSKHFFVCAEDIKVIEGNLEKEQEMYTRFPKLLTITRAMMEKDFGKTQEDFAAFVTSSPEQRYLNLLENNPQLLRRVPQHQIASYVGVTPESLSRIRKRIAENK